MADPAGSFRLACHHLRGRKTRWTTTSLVVVLYLVFNVLGRLSVAAIGLSFDLNETGVIEHPVRISYWDTNKWLQGMRYGGDTGTKGEPGSSDLLTLNLIQLDTYFYK